MNRKKNLIVIIGPNGAGKSSVAKSLLSHYPKSAFVDSGWCRVINPFPFTEVTKETVTDNIFCFIRNYLQCRDRASGRLYCRNNRNCGGLLNGKTNYSQR